MLEGSPGHFDPALLAVSDGVEARVGTLGAGREWFKPWRTIAGETLAGAHVPELQVVIEGLCAPRRFLDLLRDFIVFEDDGGRIVKKMAGYHQFHAVRAVVQSVLTASAPGAWPSPATPRRARVPPGHLEDEVHGGQLPVRSSLSTAPLRSACTSGASGVAAQRASTCWACCASPASATTARSMALGTSVSPGV